MQKQQHKQCPIKYSS